jgi:glycine cleavage system H protein
MVKIDEYDLPDDLYYTDRNLWVKVEADSNALVGFNDLASKSIGKVAFIRLMPQGRAIQKDKYLGSVESAKWVERLRSPISGTVIEVNGELKSNPTLANEDPYGAGWFVKIKPTDPESLQTELDTLIHGDAIESFMKDQIETLFSK